MKPFLSMVVSILIIFTVDKTHASRVYKSTDAEGNVTYSSTPPKNSAQTEKLNIQSKGHSTMKDSSNSNIEQIKNLAGEMEKERLQRQSDRAAANQKRELEQTKKRQQEQNKKRAEDARKQAEREAELKDRYYPLYIPRPPQQGRPVRPKPELGPQPR